MLRRWLELKTREGKLYLCAIKDAFSGRILGYSIDSRRKARLAVNALDSAVSRHGDAAGFKKSGGREPRGLTPRLSPQRASVPHQYNEHRPHTACGNQPPFSRLINVPGQDTWISAPAQAGGAPPRGVPDPRGGVISRQ